MWSFVQGRSSAPLSFSCADPSIVSQAHLFCPWTAGNGGNGQRMKGKGHRQPHEGCLNVVHRYGPHFSP
jgi:hypothetical protein